MLPGAGGTVPGDDDSWCKENDTAGDSTGTEAEKKSFPRPSIVRKRSYSFSDGHLKHPTLPPVKRLEYNRWKPGRSGGGRRRGAGESGGGSVHIVHPRPSGSKNVLSKL